MNPLEQEDQIPEWSTFADATFEMARQETLAKSRAVLKQLGICPECGHDEKQCREYRDNANLEEARLRVEQIEIVQLREHLKATLYHTRVGGFCVECGASRKHFPGCKVAAAEAALNQLEKEQG